MRLKRNTGRLMLGTLISALAISACAGSTPAPAGDSGNAQPAATAAEAPATMTVAETTAATEAPTAAAPAPEATQASATEAPAAAGGGQRTFAIDPANTVVSYEVDEEFLSGALDMLGIAAGLTKTVGRTSEVEGALTLNFDSPTPQLEAGTFTVDISTLTSDQRRRDGRIRDEWLQSSRYPLATFTATEILNAPDTYSDGEEAAFQVAGDLTIREVTNPVTFDVTATLNGDAISGVATTSFLMSTFGVEPPAMANLLTVGDNTVIRIEFVAQAQ